MTLQYGQELLFETSFLMVLLLSLYVLPYVIPIDYEMVNFRRPVGTSFSCLRFVSPQVETWGYLLVSLRDIGRVALSEAYHWRRQSRYRSYFRAGPNTDRDAQDHRILGGSNAVQITAERRRWSMYACSNPLRPCSASSWRIIPVTSSKGRRRAARRCNTRTKCHPSASRMTGLI